MAEVKRLDVAINEECANALEAYASVNGITVTEAVRHAISVLNYIDVQCALGHRMAVIDAGGSVIQILGEV